MKHKTTAMMSLAWPLNARSMIGKQTPRLAQTAVTPLAWPLNACSMIGKQTPRLAQTAVMPLAWLLNACSMIGKQTPRLAQTAVTSLAWLLNACSMAGKQTPRLAQTAVMSLALLLNACSMTDKQPPRLAQVEVPSASLPRPEDPPVYMRLLDLNIHPDLKQKVSVNFLPDNTALQSAIVSALPFPVTVLARDQQVDLRMPVAVRAEDVTVQTYLDQLASASGYDIEFSPQQRTVNVASFISRTWHVPALASMGRFKARLGLSSDDDDQDNDANVQRSHELNTVHQYEDDSWQSLLNSAHCIMRTASCQSDDVADDDAPAPDRAQPLADSDKNWVVGNRRLGTISAGGHPQDVHKLDKWLSALAKDSLNLVHLECAILDVAIDDIDMRDFDFDLLFGDSEDYLRASRQRRAAASDNRNDWTLGAIVNSGRFDLDLFIHNLSQRSDVSVKSRARLTVTNGATAYLNTGEVFSYVSNIDAVVTEGAATTSFNQSRLQVGLELAVTPRTVGKSNKILVEVVPVLSSLLRFDQLSDGERTVKAPVIALRQLSSQAITRNGRPVTVGGLNWDRLQNNNSAFSKHRWVRKFISDQSKQSESRQLVIIITPWRAAV